MGSFRIVKLTDPIQFSTITGGLVPRGAYAAGTDYAVGDSVDYGGSSYVMFSDAVAGTLPTNTTYWQVLANKGTTGATGSTGATGASGVVQSVVAGTNVTVNSTDPANPIVSATGGGGGGTPGGSDTQVQYNNAGSFGGITGATTNGTALTLVAPVLGTPASGTLTNATGLPVAGITSSTSTALGVGSLELGHATDTTLSRSSAGVLAVEGVVVPTISSTNTLTNKTLSGNTATNLISGSGTLTLNTTGTATVPNATDTLVGKATTDTLTNKTIDADGTGNSITNIENADIKAAAAIALNKLAATTVSRALVSDASGFVSAATTTSTEIGYVNGVTSAVQTQLDAKTAKATLTTKGDTYVATAASTVVRQAVGSDGQVLTADSSVTNGLKWSAVSGGTTNNFNTLTYAQKNLTGSGLSALTGAVDGANTAFTVPGSVYIAGTLVVYLNGVLQVPGDAITETTPASGIFNFVTAPVTNDQIYAVYQASTITTTNLNGALFDYFTDATVGGAEADIYTSTISASRLGTNGDKLYANYGGNFVTIGTESTQLKAYFAGTVIWDSAGIAPSSGTSSWRITVEIIRVNATTIRHTVSLNTTGASGFTYCTSGELTGLTLSNTNIMKITGTSTGVGSGSGDIIGKMGSISWSKAA